MYDVKSMPQSDTIASLGINNCLQIIETGFAEWFYASYRMGACTDSFENFRENSLKGDLSNDITLNHPLFSLVNAFKYCKIFLKLSSLSYSYELINEGLEPQKQTRPRRVAGRKKA